MEETEVGSKSSEQLAMRKMEIEERQREQNREFELELKRMEMEERKEERQKSREFEERQKDQELELRNKELEHKVTMAASKSTFDVSKHIRFVLPFQEKVDIFCVHF